MSFTLPESLTEDVVRGGSGLPERTVWSFSAAGQPAVAVIFLDGKLYLHRVEATGVVERLARDGEIPPVASVFVSAPSAAARHVDFACQPDYAAFVGENLIAWVRERYPTIREIVLAGLSLSGLAAAFTATRFPHAFAATICQSPSFWWEDGRFFKDLLPAAKPGQKLWVCVGDRETDASVSHPPTGMLQRMTQIEGCDAGCAALEVNGYDVRYRKYAGGHDPVCWRDDLALALPWACRASAASP